MNKSTVSAKKALKRESNSNIDSLATFRKSVKKSVNVDEKLKILLQKAEEGSSLSIGSSLELDDFQVTEYYDNVAEACQVSDSELTELIYRAILLGVDPTQLKNTKIKEPSAIAGNTSKAIATPLAVVDLTSDPSNTLKHKIVPDVIDLT